MSVSYARKQFYREKDSKNEHSGKSFKLFSISLDDICCILRHKVYSKVHQRFNVMIPDQKLIEN